ncbi:MAG: T9SS type A sorting domain-containing protein [Bacteroidota bacterium]
MSMAVSSAPAAPERNWAVDVYPNPFGHAPEIWYELSTSTALSFSLTDVTGKVLYAEKTGRQSAGRYRFEVPDVIFEQLPAGLYFLRGENGVTAGTFKLVKIAK